MLEDPVREQSSHQKVDRAAGSVSIEVSPFRERIRYIKSR